MPNQLSKFQPNRTMALRGFDGLGASAALHSATADAFTVSGTFRDSADFAVLMLWDADNFYEHPRLRHLPDFNFAGGVLTFDVSFSNGLQPLDSPKSNWIDWATLDYVPTSGEPGTVRIWDHCMLKTGAFTSASGTFRLKSSGGGMQPTDRLTIFFQNFSFDYQPAANSNSVQYSFFAAGNGTEHTITINLRAYTHTENTPTGESSAEQAAALIALINSGAGDPDATAAIGPESFMVVITVRAGKSASVSATGYGTSPLGLPSLALAAANLAQQINNTDWWTQNATNAIRAKVLGNTLTVNAARYGRVSTAGTAVTKTSGAVFSGLSPGMTLTIAGVFYTIASVESPSTLTLTTSAGDQTGKGYVADRGGSDGNMIELYALSASPALSTEESFVRLSGGSSQVAWTCIFDFTKLAVTNPGIESLRQCWFTYAAELANGRAFQDSEWSATYTNWRFTGPDAATKLWVAGPGSVRVEENSTACTYSGAWAVRSPESNFFSQGLARRAGQPDSVTSETLAVRYTCASVHDLYLGTSLYIDRANVLFSLDGAPELLFSQLYLKSATAVIGRRRLLAAVPAGEHNVRFRLATPGYFYFDFLEAAVVSDVPAPPEPRPNLSPALDYSTDHSWKLPPARILWILDNLGFTGPVNQYIGVFWWNQRRNPTMSFSSARITCPVPPAAGTILQIEISGAFVQKTVVPADTPSSIAAHFARYINSGFVGIWASAAGAQLTITVRSPAYSFELKTYGLPVTGDLKTSNFGLWEVDPAQSPALNRGARDWHADLYRECKLRNREVTTAGSMELVNPPAGFAACFSNNVPVVTDVGFGGIHSTHCAQSSPMRNYQKSVFECIADLQNDAGLTPNFQLGEYLWWFFPLKDESKPPRNISMAFYDPETKAAAQTALGRPLHIFLDPNDNPGVNAGADALFLRARLRDHCAAIISHVRARYPNAIAEILFAYDVNYPVPNTDKDGPLGGALNRFINFPAEWGSHSTAGFTRLKVEALAFGSRFRDLNLARAAIEFPLAQDWPLERIRYLAPIFTHSSAWQKEVAIAMSLRIPVINLWAFDQMNIFGLKIGRYHNQSRSLKMG